MSEKRFEIMENEGVAKAVYIIVDKETGVNYLFSKFGNAGGLCPLLDSDGKPIITSDKK